PYLKRGEWYTTKLGRSGKTCDWRTSYGFGATFNQISEFWAFPENSVLDGPVVKYELLDDGTARLTDYFGFDSVIEIPAVVDGFAVSELGSGLFSGNIQAERVVLPEGIRKIGSEAFLNCTNLASIELPSTIRAIGEKAFSNCEALTAVNLSDCRIGERAFFRCKGLTSIVISGTAAVEKEAFAACGTAATLDLTGLYGSIGEGGFASCGISLLSLPDFPIKVDKDAFGGAAVTEVIIPGGMKKIAARMFEGCWYLEKVTIGEGIEAIENEAFANCQALSEVILPSTLRSIGNGAFSRSTAISAVSVPEGVRTLGEEAFLGCSALRLIVLPESLESIGTKAFFGCAELNELHIPGAQTQIADYILNRENTVIIGSAGSTAQAHAQQRGLEFRETAGTAVSTGVSNTDDFLLNERSDGTLCITLYKGPGGEVVVPDSVNGKKIAAVGAEAFSGNESVQSVVLPDSVLEIGDKAFFGCKNLERVRIPAEAAQFGRFIFTNCPKLVVQVAAGSQAEAYADANRLKKDVR
ncbi:MAG: leucine-rich repeat domain-containing protein, partial [Clostridia bacterium]|nr:leucine-rich repeat domain-containing protein [Clostridia bacterium]